jgi:integrase
MTATAPLRAHLRPAKNANPTFHEFASDWFAAKQLEIEKNTASSYGNDLTNHLLPFFMDHRISEITVAEVDRYRQSKVREAAEISAAAENGTPLTVSYVDRLGRSYRRRARPLSPRSINMHIDLLTQILAVAVDHGHIPSNPAVGKRRRLKLSKPRPVHLDSAQQIALLLEAAGQLDRGETVIDVTDRRGRSWTQRHPIYTTGRRAAIATLLLGGGRASGHRRDALARRRPRKRTLRGRPRQDRRRHARGRHAAAAPGDPDRAQGRERADQPDDPVFVTSAGKPRSRHNIRQDVVDAAVAHANRLVEERGLQPLPLGITPHKLRHTFACILVAIGKDPTYVMQQLGHTDPAFTLRVYAHVMRRSEEERERLKALVEGPVWAVNGQYAPDSAPQARFRSDS